MMTHRNSFLAAFRNLYILSYRKITFVFTDGSKFEQNNCMDVGIYSSSLQLELMHRLPANVSIFTVEVLLVTLKLYVTKIYLKITSLSFLMKEIAEHFVALFDFVKIK